MSDNLSTSGRVVPDPEIANTDHQVKECLADTQGGHVDKLAVAESDTVTKTKLFIQNMLKKGSLCF